MPLRKGRKKLFEMELLTAVRNVNDLVGMPGFQTILERGEIGCCVIGRPITLLNQCRVSFQLWLIVKEYNDGTFALPCQTFIPQLLDDQLQSIVVKALTQCHIEFDPEPCID